MLGNNFRITSFQAALGTAQLRRLDAVVARRAALADRYDALLTRHPRRRAATAPAGTAPAPGTSTRSTVDPEPFGCDRDTVIDALRAEGIEATLHYPAVHLLSLYRARGGRPGMAPRAEDLCSRLVTLPLFPAMSEADQDDVVAALARSRPGQERARSRRDGARAAGSRLRRRGRPRPPGAHARPCRCAERRPAGVRGGSAGRGPAAAPRHRRAVTTRSSWRATPWPARSAAAEALAADVFVLDGYVFTVEVQQTAARPGPRWSSSTTSATPPPATWRSTPSPGGEGQPPPGADAFLGGAAYALLSSAFLAARAATSGPRPAVGAPSLVSTGATDLQRLITAGFVVDVLARDPDGRGAGGRSARSDGRRRLPARPPPARCWWRRRAWPRRWPGHRVRRRGGHVRRPGGLRRRPRCDHRRGRPTRRGRRPRWSTAGLRGRGRTRDPGRGVPAPARRPQPALRMADAGRALVDGAWRRARRRPGAPPGPNPGRLMRALVRRLRLHRQPPRCQPGQPRRRGVRLRRRCRGCRGARLHRCASNGGDPPRTRPPATSWWWRRPRRSTSRPGVGVAARR